MSDKVFIECPSCLSKDKFMCVLEGSYFNVFCNFCNTHIRKIPSWKLAPHLEKAMKDVVMPFGRYKGTIISSMNKKEEIDYLTWFRTSGAWKTTNDIYKNVINQHLDNHKTGVTKISEEEIPVSKRTHFNPLDEFDNNFNENDLVI